MDFAALISAAANNAKNAGKAVAKLDSEVEAEKKRKVEMERKERQREKAVIKKPSLQPSSFKIPVVRNEQVKESMKAAAPSSRKSSKVTMRPPPSIGASKGAVAPHTKTQAPSKPHPKPAKGQVRPLSTQDPKGKENKAESRKRPPVDFTNLMKMATDISQGKKVEEPKEPSRKSFKMNMENKKSLVPNMKASQKPSLPLLQTSISSFVVKKPAQKVEKMTAKVTQRRGNAEVKRFKGAAERRRSGHIDRKNEQHFDEDEEEDDDMSDFIDDDEVDDFNQQEMAEALRAVNRKYDTDKWRNRERTISDRHMTADYRTIAREEAQSARIGRLEDAMEMKRHGTRAV